MAQKLELLLILKAKLPEQLLLTQATAMAMILHCLLEIMQCWYIRILKHLIAGVYMRTAQRLKFGLDYVASLTIQENIGHTLIGMTAAIVSIQL